jgi:paraquat-inducible protein A
MTIACSECGTLQDLPRLDRVTAAICPTCTTWMERTSGRSASAGLACALATFIVMFPANLLPLMSVSVLGMSREGKIPAGVISLWNGQWVIVASLVAAFAIVLPFVRFGLLSLVLAHVWLDRHRPWLGRAFRWSLRLDHWAMPDVFLIGFAIGYSRVAANLTVSIEPGGLCLIAAALLAMLSRATLDRRTVWRAISPERRAPEPAEPAISCPACELVLSGAWEGSACPRCQLRVTSRKPDSMVRTTALLVAAFALYFPANVYPMSIAVEAGRQTSHRIIDGVRELFQAGLWPLGVIIFCTSIAIPLLKILGLAWLQLSIWRRSDRGLVFKTHFYRFIDEIGRWSSVDVFTIAVFVPLMQFGAIASARAAWGATPFMLVVVLTMLASRSFDPRLLWDAAAARVT